MQAPVIDLSTDHALMLDLADVTFVRLGENRRDLLFATHNNTLRLVRSIQELTASLEGSEFLRVNQNIIVNMERAIRYDYKEYELIFETSGADHTESCPVSRDNRAKVRKWFMEY